LVDDALDYKGDAEALGKNVGDDLAEGKPTLPLIRAMEKAPAADRELIRNAISNGDASQLSQVVAIVEATGAMEYTLEAARAAVARALEALTALPDGRYRTALADVAEFATGRDH